MTRPTVAEVACPSCGAVALAADRFCETCGTTLSPTEDSSPAPAPTADADASAPEPGACVKCGAAPERIDGDGYCQECGFKQPSPRDHQEIDLGAAAGVTDRGLHHRRNEDAMALAWVADPTLVAVVCDGVSTSIDPDIASQAAADAAAAVLADAVHQRPDQLEQATVDAVAAAQAAVTSLVYEPDGLLPAPSCTFVSAVVHDGRVTLGWLGDSRAYWLGPPRAQRLTTDDSWATEMVAAGSMTEEEAEADDRAHSITRWIGSDSPDGPPHVTTFEPPAGPGSLLVCSDGLWNYAPGADRIAELAGAIGGNDDDGHAHGTGGTDGTDGPAGRGTPSALAVARHLTDFARDAGGHDNITVLVIPIDPAGPPQETPPA